MTLVSIILAAVAILLWLALTATVVTMNDNDPAGNGLSYAYGVYIAIALWVVLALLVALAALQWGIPGWTRLAALLLVPASGVAAISAMYLMTGRPELRWPLVVPILAPALIIGFCLWAAIPALRSSVSETAASAIAWGLVLVLCVIPWPAHALRSRQGAANRSRIEAELKLEEARQQEAKRQERLANFHKLTPQSPLWEWMPFILDSSELTGPAWDSVLQLASRQADAEAMLEQGHHFPLIEIASLDLQITPRFCDLSRAFLIKHARDWRTTLPVPPEYSVRSARIEQLLPAMKYLVAHGCDVQPAIAELMETVRGYPTSPERERFLGELQAL